MIIFMNSIFILFVEPTFSLQNNISCDRNSAGLKWITQFSVAFISVDDKSVGLLSDYFTCNFLTSLDVLTNLYPHHGTRGYG